MDIEALTKELKELCAEGNNGDYYLSGYVDADALEKIIRKHLDPEYKYYNPHWGKIPSVNKEPTPAQLTMSAIVRDVYSPMIVNQLEAESFINRLFP